MKTLFILVAAWLMYTNGFSQSNYSFTNTATLVTTYQDISGAGTAISMTNPESGNSVSPINIGFNFNFNGTIFNECMIHADGLLRFGTAAPGSYTSLFESNTSANGEAFSTSDINFQNVIFAFFLDLVQGAAAPEYHVLTEGFAPNRVTTIQWKNLKDNFISLTNSPSQYDNMEFQVKLFETSNNIAIVMGNFLSSNISSNVQTRGAQVGIKASGTSFIGLVKLGSNTPFNLVEYYNPAAHVGTNAEMPFRKDVLPTPGLRYLFYGQRNVDVNIAEVYSESVLIKTSVASTQNRVRIKNEGVNVLSNIAVTMQITGANNVSQTVNIPTLAAGVDVVVEFSGYNLSNAGEQQVNFTAIVAADELPANNSVVRIQKVSNNFVQVLSDSIIQRVGVGFNSVTNNEIAIKILGTGTRRLSQVRVPARGYLSNISLKVLEDNGSGFSPGTVLFTSSAVNNNGDNDMLFNLSTPVTVTGDYFIAIRQNNIINMGVQIALQNPLPSGKIYNGFGVTYTVEGPDRSYFPMIKTVEETNLIDVGIVAVNNPSCNYGTAEQVRVLLRNYSSQMHDFITHPVTISGSVINSVTNTPVPFSILKNTGTLAGNGTEEVTVVNSYDFSVRGSHRFIARATTPTDAEPINDSLSFVIHNNLRYQRSFIDSVCPSTAVTITPFAIYNNVQWNVNGTITNANTLTFTPTETTLVRATATDSRGCTIIDSLFVPFRTTNLPPEPIISFNDTLQSFRNGFSDTLIVAPLAGHSINWIGGGIPINGGQQYIVRGFRSITPEPHRVYYNNIAEGCGGFTTNINTRFAPGILLNNNNDITVCDTSFYDAGGATGNYAGNNSFTKTFYPATPGRKVKLSLYNLKLGQFSILNIYDGVDVGSARLDELNQLSTDTLREYTASNADGAITVNIQGNNSSNNGWLAGITCEQPLQFRSVQNGLFTSESIWESKLPGVLNYQPATRAPNKADDSILIRHAVSVPANTVLPLDQTVIETTGTLTVPSNSSLRLYTNEEAYEITVLGTLTAIGNIFGSPNASSNGKIALAGTLNVSDQINIDSVVVIPAANPAVINASGNANVGKLQINNVAGVNLNGNLDIVSALDLRNGVLQIAPSNFIRIVSGNGGVVAGGSNNSYVSGKLRIQSFITSDPLLFPVGKNGIYRLISILPNQNSFDFSVEYQAELFSGAPPTRTLPSTLNNINQQWYHTINITDGINNLSDATVTIHYEAADAIGNTSLLRIAKDDGATNWLDIGGTGTTLPSGTITSNSFSSFSDFVLANITGGPLPVTLIQFNGKAISNGVELTWVTENEIDLAGYEVERSKDGLNFERIGYVLAKSGSSANNYMFKDLLAPNNTVLYYRLKMLDFDGKFSYSNIVLLRRNGYTEDHIISVSPNPFVKQINIQYQSAQNETIQLQLLDAAGKLLMNKQVSVFTGINQLILNVVDVPNGVYFIRLMNKEKLLHHKIVRQ